MMYTSKERYAVMTFLLFTLGRGVPFGQRYNPVIPPLSWHLMPPWKYMLSDIILKSVSPSSLDTNAPYKRTLDASYYGGPVVAHSDDDKNVILSRGNVYHLPNGHWILCQDECVDCEPCAVQRNPVFTWILRRIKQQPNSMPTRYDLQLTIMPQTSNYFHTNNLWPIYYVYVTPQEESMSISTIRTQHDSDPKDLPCGLENNFSEHHHRSKNSWGLTERDSSDDQDRVPQEDNHATVQESVNIEKIEKEESSEWKHELENMRPQHRPRPRPVEKLAEEVNQLAPRLILGTDQKGQKHLVHLVPANYPTTTALSEISLSSDQLISPQFVEDQKTYSNNTISKDERQTYQEIFRRVFDSLNTHRQSIENFLESSTDNVDEHRLSAPSIDNMEAAGFSWNNRDVNHKSANFNLNEALLLPFHAGNENKTGKYQRYRNRYDNKHIKQNNDYYMTAPDMNQAKISRSQSQTGFNFDIDRQRRRVRIKPYFVNSKDISRINSSLSLQSLNNYLVNATQESGFNNGFAVDSAKQIDLNDTFVEKANDNSIKSSLITKQENGQLFGLERPGSGDVNREFKVSHDAFKVITVKSPVIRSKTLNRTTI
ncbi:PREDICTED: uncharacterized protein LOC108754865 [Trachymyrmex septentrionalis]|uniref:uncharacterized protein LOC108754865 n=1 Tax=Trachymyrmex septentrionalis TaxID=34720 RepID=UPI00084ED9C7|nr:PREDICTED: uncharacterized protein LOC108754865 [Trachymyrmex septentrionalis]